MAKKPKPYIIVSAWEQHTKWNFWFHAEASRTETGTPPGWTQKTAHPAQNPENPKQVLRFAILFADVSSFWRGFPASIVSLCS